MKTIGLSGLGWLGLGTIAATAKERRPEAKDFIDATLIEEIKKSGYIERLYGR